MPHQTLSTRNDNEQKINYDRPYIHCIISFVINFIIHCIIKFKKYCHQIFYLFLLGFTSADIIFQKF